MLYQPHLRRLSSMLIITSTLAACTGAGDGTVTGTDVIRNDGSTPTLITSNGVDTQKNFVCTESVVDRTPVASVGTAGLVGGSLTRLLASLGGTQLTDLLNSVQNKDSAIDGNLDTYASVNLTLGLLGGLLSSVDETVEVPIIHVGQPGEYAAFAVSFPTGVANLTLLNAVRVRTFLHDGLQEETSINQSALSLLTAVGGSLPATAYVGLQATRPFDKATISLIPGLLTVNVGDAMRIHELCVNGRLAPKS